MQDFHVVHIDAELIRHNLGEGCLLALAMRGCTDHDVHLPKRMEAQ
jgi:hypothetical protein